MSSYRFLGEDGLLQHHGPGLTEAVSGALGSLDAQLHRSLRRRAALWRQNQRRLLRGTLDVRDSVVHKHFTHFEIKEKSVHQSRVQSLNLKPSVD